MDLIVILEFLAVIVSAIYGILLATRTGMDFVGCFTISFAAAFGGGTLRDLFLDRHPLFWVGNPHYPITVFIICLILPFYAKHLPKIKPIIIYPDALAMALYTAVGTAIALEHQGSWFIVVLLGTITGTFGGVIADVICNEVPSIFKPSPLYATCAFAGAWVYVLGSAAELPSPLPMAATIILVTGLRILAVRLNWSYPPLRTPSS